MESVNLRTAAQDLLDALERGDSFDRLEDVYAPALRAALEEPKRAACRYPDCVDSGPDGKCTRWLLCDCDGGSSG